MDQPGRHGPALPGPGDRQLQRRAYLKIRDHKRLKQEAVMGKTLCRCTASPHRKIATRCARRVYLRTGR